MFFDFDIKGDTHLQPADRGETTGFACLRLLRIGFGRTIEVSRVDKEGSDIYTISQKEKRYSIATRIAAVAIFILFLPVTSILAGVGMIALMRSSSWSSREPIINALLYKSPHQNHNSDDS